MNLSQVIIDQIDPGALDRLGSKDRISQHRVLSILLDKRVSEIARDPTGSLISAIEQLPSHQGPSPAYEIWRDWYMNAKTSACASRILREAFDEWKTHSENAIRMRNISSSSDEGPPPLVSSSSDDMGDLRQRATDNSPDDESSDPDSSFDWENSPFEISRMDWESAPTLNWEDL